jgi:hypothetical protein
VFANVVALVKDGGLAVLCPVVGIEDHTDQGGAGYQTW